MAKSRAQLNRTEQQQSCIKALHLSALAHTLIMIIMSSFSLLAGIQAKSVALPFDVMATPATPFPPWALKCCIQLDAAGIK